MEFAKVILVPSDSATVLRSGRDGVADPAPATVVPVDGLANRTDRSMSGEPCQDVIVAPGMHRGR
jgi:hypothetical protein